MTIAFDYSNVSLLTAYTLDQANKTKNQKVVNADPTVKSSINYFKANIGKVKSVDDLFKDYKLMSFVLTATGLEDQIGLAGRAKAALTQKVSDKDALMNKLTTPPFKAAAQVLQFGETGLATIQSASGQQQLISLYQEQKYDDQLAVQAPEVAYAEQFQQKASSVSSYYDILGDSTLREVVTTALGLPKEIAYQSVDTQAAAIQSRLKLSDLKNSDFVKKFTQRYLVMAEQSRTTGSSNSGQSWILNLFT